MLREQTQHLDGLPINVFIKSVEKEYFHFHKDLEIILVLKGSVDIKIGYLTSRKTKGDLIIIDSEDLHSIYRTEEDNLLLFIHVDLLQYEKQYPYIDFMIFACESFVSDSIFIKTNIEKKVDQLRKYIVRIMFEAYEKNSGYKDKIKELVDAFVLLLINDFQYFFIEDNEFKYNEKSQQNKLNFDRIYRIIMYIYNHYHHKITLNDIAEHEYLSTYYVSHMIKNTTGLSFQEFLNFVRVGYAEILLLSTDKTITEIALECGFSSAKYLNKYFKKWYHCKPNEYRKLWYEDSLHLGKKKYIHYDFQEALKEITKYLESETTNHFNQPLNEREIIEIHPKKGIEKLSIQDTLGFYIEDIRQGFDVNFHSQLKETAKSISFEYLGLPDVFTRNIYNDSHDYFLLKQFLDFLMTLNIKPYFYIEYPPKIEIEQKLTNIKQFIKTNYSPQIIKKWKYRLLYKNASVDDIQAFSKMLRKIVNAEILTEHVHLDIINRNNILNDTEYIVPLIIHNILNRNSSNHIFLNMIGDSYNDQPIFHGGKGIMTVNGLKKPSFYAYYLLSKLGKTLLKKGDHHIATKDGDDIQILIFGKPLNQTGINFYHENGNRRPEKHIASLSNRKNEFLIRINNLKGKYSIIRYKNNNKENYIYQNWINMGCPANMTDEDSLLMNMATVPSISFETIHSSHVELHSQINDFGIELIIFKKIAQ